MSKDRSSPVTLAKLRAEVRRAVADYMKSEGCSCCSDREAHEAARTRLGKLLNVPVTRDWYGPGEGGYNFSPYRSPE